MITSAFEPYGLLFTELFQHAISTDRALRAKVAARRARDRLGRSETASHHPVLGYAAPDERADHCFRPRLRQRQVHRHPSAAVGVPLHLDAHHLGMRLEDLGELVEQPCRTRMDQGLAWRE